MKTNTIQRIAVFALAMIMICMTIPAGITANAATSISKGNAAATTETTILGTESWVNNVIVKDPFEVFKVDREDIISVTFHDNVNEAPKNAWNIGKGANSRVKGWIEWIESEIHFHFAANGGINGEACTEAMFENCSNLEEVNFNGAFHTDHAVSMENMFKGCENLKHVDIETLNTVNVTTTYQMFRDCISLETLDMTNFSTDNVTTTYAMFSTCRNLKHLDLSSFNTSKVTSMAFMFSACKTLEVVDVTSFNTANVRNMEGMFRWCDSLEILDLSNWDVTRVNQYSNFMDAGYHINSEPWVNFFN